jgi:hypothetical protein
MCRALTVLCAAPDGERLAALKRAAVAAEWELVGGATDVDQLLGQVRERSPHVVVIEGLPPDAPARVREASATARILIVDDHQGPDADGAGSDPRILHIPVGTVREAIMGLPSPGGPVRR